MTANNYYTAKTRHNSIIEKIMLQYKHIIIFLELYITCHYILLYDSEDKTLRHQSLIPGKWKATTKVAWHRTKRGLLESGEGVRGKSGVKRILFERSELIRDLIFLVRPSALRPPRRTERIPGVCFFGYFLSHKQRK